MDCGSSTPASSAGSSRWLLPRCRGRCGRRASAVGSWGAVRSVGDGFVFFGAQVEREHEIPLVVLARDHVLDADVEPVGSSALGAARAETFSTRGSNL